MATIFCFACGRRVPADSTFCPYCGARQERAVPVARPSSSTLHPVVVAAFLLFFPPVGLILMWTSTDWDPDVKWGISGLFFPPLWLRFLWKVWWLPYAVGAFLAALILHAMIFGGFSTTGGIVILLLIAILLVLTSPRPSKPAEAPADVATGLREAIGHKLDLCHDLIAEIEQTVALDLLPADSPVRLLYARALEQRSEALDLLNRAASQRELLAVDERVSRTLSDLRAVKDGLPAAGG
jgi:hypothetical protein